MPSNDQRPFAEKFPHYMTAESSKSLLRLSQLRGELRRIDGLLSQQPPLPAAAMPYLVRAALQCRKDLANLRGSWNGWNDAMSARIRANGGRA